MRHRFQIKTKTGEVVADGYAVEETSDIADTRGVITETLFAQIDAGFGMPGTYMAKSPGALLDLVLAATTTSATDIADLSWEWDTE